MRPGSILSVLLLGATTCFAMSNPHERARRNVAKPVLSRQNVPRQAKQEQRSTEKYSNAAADEFLVDGKAIPEVAFDIGESYAGLLPNTPHGNSSLWFWFFPSENSKADKEITIWLNGGPGCSSLNGLLQENGPFLWQPGTNAPVKNPYPWTNLTNVVYIDQPAGTGFSPGPPSVNNEIDVANQFNDFWKRFMTTFGMEDFKVYITGESYAGQYIPYIADNMLKRKNKTYYNLKGIQIIDPSVNEDDVIIEAPAVRALNKYNSVIGLNESFVSAVNQRADSCGYTSFMEQSLTFPPKGKLPTAPSSNKRGCDVWDDIVAAAYYVNPCFNIYHLTDYCPYLWNEMGFPSLGGGPNNYFNRTDVQKALHTKPTNYMVCGEYEFLRPDGSVPSGLGPLPHVIEATNNVILAHGNLDFLLFTEGSLVTIQNMTWHGKQGFQEAPSDDFYVPYHPQLRELLFGTTERPFTQTAGAGILGKTRTERGLTFVTVDLAGHEIPQYAPGAAYRQLEVLLGRVKSLTEKSDFTTLPGDFTGTRPPFPPGEGLAKGILADGRVLDGAQGRQGGRSA